MYKLLTMALSLLLFASPGWGQNPNEVSFGGYTVNYNAFPSTTLEPSVAKALGISRASYRGIITISVRMGPGNPVDAEVKGTVTNLIGQRPRLEFERVKDADSLYYLSEFTIPRGTDRLTFNISVKPEGTEIKKEIEFKRHY